jgi:hypothetical protein
LADGNPVPHAALPLCNDDRKTAGETDVDCGGFLCGRRCHQGQSCLIDTDCMEGLGCDPIRRTCVLVSGTAARADRIRLRRVLPHKWPQPGIARPLRGRSDGR